jgi:hypothetical protein
MAISLYSFFSAAAAAVVVVRADCWWVGLG